MIEKITLLQAFHDGKLAAKNAGNPYTQKDGELWHVDNQDQLFDAWQRGHYEQGESKR